MDGLIAAAVAAIVGIAALFGLIVWSIHHESSQFKEDCLAHGWYYYKLGDTGYCDSDGKGP